MQGTRTPESADNTPQKQESLRKQRDRYQGRKPPGPRRIREEPELRSADGGTEDRQTGSPSTQHRGSKGHRLGDQRTPSGKGSNTHVSSKYTWTDSQEAREATSSTQGTDRQTASPRQTPVNHQTGSQGE